MDGQIEQKDATYVIGNSFPIPRCNSHNKRS